MSFFPFKVPYQQNGWDCGVFVCRYAFSVLSLRRKPFQFDGSKQYVDKEAQKSMKNMLNTEISESTAFTFGMDDIERLRREFATLIDKLSDLYKVKEKARLDEKKRIQNATIKLGEQTINSGGVFV